MGSVFVQAAVILLREGLEALLVLAALLPISTRRARATGFPLCTVAPRPPSLPA